MDRPGSDERGERDAERGDNLPVRYTENLLPVAPGTLFRHLLEQGYRPAEDDLFPCPTCTRRQPAFALRDVRDAPGVPHDFICGLCIIEGARGMQAIIEGIGALFAPPNWKGVVAERRRRLTESLWATASDGTVSEAERAAWGVYRAAVAAVGPETAKSPRLVEWPAAPE